MPGSDPMSDKITSEQVRVDDSVAQLLIELAFLIPKGDQDAFDSVSRKLVAFRDALLDRDAEKLTKLQAELKHWQICENCGEPLEGPGICSKAISEREKGLELMHEEALTRA